MPSPRAVSTGAGVALSSRFSHATVGGALYEVDEHTPDVVREFLSRSLSNNRYDSDAHLAERAKNYLAYIEGEERLIKRAHLALQDPESPAFKQSTWLCHLERRLWQSEPALRRLNREQPGSETGEAPRSEPALPYVRKWEWPLSPVSASAVSMMIKEEAGPLTLAQSKAGFETVQELLMLACKVLKISERKTDRKDHRHDAERNKTHATETPEGTDLSRDAGTRVRDAYKLPVMSGTSGSSSDVALAARYGARQAGLSWMAPGLDRETAEKAMVDLALDFFRTEGSGPPVYLARKMNEIRTGLGLPVKDVEAHQVFSHSFPEIHAGMGLTLQDIPPDDPQAVEQALDQLTRKAKERLDAEKAG